MKKMLAVLGSIFFFTASCFAANAMLFDITDVQQSNPPNLTWAISVIYVGSDVPGGSLRDEFTFNASTSATPAQLSAAAVAAVQANATAKGFTVPANRTLMPSFSLQ